MNRHRPGLSALALCTAACAATPRPRAPAPPRRVVLSVVGTNDLHGRVGMLPWLGGHVANLRRARARDGAVLLLDGGDMFQGTLESNLNEGAAVVRAYNALGYDAAAVGNHEFDYGPEGDDHRAEADPQGALRARAREARFPLLTANIVDGAGAALPWENVRADVVREFAGVRVGIIGLSTEATARATLMTNLRGLAVRPLAEALHARVAAVRAQGAAAVVVVAHAGGQCQRFDDPADLSSCDADDEVFRLARALAPGEVDVIVAGHTHLGVAHVVNGVAVIESYANGRAFGRVDLTVELPSMRVVDRRVHAPREVCGARGAGRDEPDPSDCAPEPYEGAAVTADPDVAAAIAPAVEAARSVRARPVGLRVETPVRGRYRDESALTNFIADVMRAALPGADGALMNAGGVRVDLPAGPLDYGTLYGVIPFDNRLVAARVRGAALREVLTRNAGGDSGTLALSGLRVTATCEGGALALRLLRADGRAVGDDEVLTLATNDYLARGTLGRHTEAPLTDEAVAAAPPLRDALLPQLAALGSVRGEDPRWYDPAHPRMALPSARPVRCPAASRP